MTKQLVDLFNLSEKEQAAPSAPEPEKEHAQVQSIEDSIKAVEAITSSLPQIKELDDLNDKELDDLAKKAEDAYDDLMDLGMNVEVRYSGRIFEVASSMIKNAIDAKGMKMEKKLKAIDLQLKKLKIDNDTGKDPHDMINGQGYVVTDRNELLKKLQNKG